MAKNSLDQAYTEYKEKFNELKAKAEDLIATKSSTFSSSIDVSDGSISSEELCKCLCKEFPQLRFTLVFESGKRKIAFQPYVAAELVKLKLPVITTAWSITITLLCAMACLPS